MYPLRKAGDHKKKKTEVSTSIFVTPKKQRVCTCGEALKLVTIKITGPVDERTVMRRYPAVEVCPKCRVADLSPLTRWDRDPVRDFLAHEWVPKGIVPPKKVDLRRK